VTAPELARRQAGAALVEALDVLSGALPRAVALAREEERAAERAAVVAWLLEQIGLPGLSMAGKSLLVWASRRIERGEHRHEEKNE
jgi:hypothetical protein